jgi:hypothetical protein
MPGPGNRGAWLKYLNYLGDGAGARCRDVPNL